MDRVTRRDDPTTRRLETGTEDRGTHREDPTTRGKKTSRKRFRLTGLSKAKRLRKKKSVLDRLIQLTSIKVKNVASFLTYGGTLNREGDWGTTYDFATSFLHFPLSSTALWDSANSRPVDSLMLSSHLFFCLPCLLPFFTVPCKMVLARPDQRETCPLQFASLYDGQEVFVWSDCLLDLGTVPS